MHLNVFRTFAAVILYATLQSSNATTEDSARLVSTIAREGDGLQQPPSSVSSLSTLISTSEPAKSVFTLPDFSTGGAGQTQTMDVTATAVAATSVASATTEIQREILERNTGIPPLHVPALSTTMSATTNASSDDPIIYVHQLWSLYPMQWTWYTGVQLAISVCGILCNFLVMLVTFHRTEVSRSTDVLVGALALADCLASIFLIPVPHMERVPSSWVGHFYCKVIHSKRLVWIPLAASILTLTVLSIERFVAIVYPFRFKQVFTRRCVSAYIGMCWLGAVALNAVPLWYEHADETSNACFPRLPPKAPSISHGFAWFLFVLLVPAIVIGTTHSSTGEALEKQSKHIQGELPYIRPSPGYRLHVARKRVMRVLRAVIAVYVLCIAPGQVTFLVYHIGMFGLRYDSDIIGIRILEILSFLKCCLNPVIYWCLFWDFRWAVRDLFFRNGSASTRTPLFQSKYESSVALQLTLRKNKQCEPFTVMMHNGSHKQ